MIPIAQVRFSMLLLAMAVGSGCAHTPPPAREVHIISADATGVGANAELGTGGAGADAYCGELQNQCFEKCWRRKPSITSIKKHSGDHHEHCTSQCLQVFMKCIKEQEALEQQDTQKGELRFPTMTAALDWLKEHKTEVIVGTVVVVGSAMAAPYVIAVVGGALILAPL